MEHVLLVVHVVIAAALIGVVLIQRSDTDGFGLGSGSGSNFMTGRAAASLLTRTTAILATLFIVNSLVLSILAARTHSTSIVDTIVEQETSQPVVPLAMEKGDIAASEKKSTSKKSMEKTVEKSAVPAVPNAE